MMQPERIHHMGDCLGTCTHEEACRHPASTVLANFDWKVHFSIMHCGASLCCMLPRFKSATIAALAVYGPSELD